MKIAILSRNSKIYSTRRLIEAAKERGHEVRVLDVLRCYMNITSHRPGIHYKGEDLEHFDAVIPRIGASVTFYGCAVLRQFGKQNPDIDTDNLAATRCLEIAGEAIREHTDPVSRLLALAEVLPDAAEQTRQELGSEMRQRAAQPFQRQLAVEIVGEIGRFLEIAIGLFGLTGFGSRAAGPIIAFRGDIG